MHAAAAADFALGSDRRAIRLHIRIFSLQLFFAELAINAGLRELEYRWKIQRASIQGALTANYRTHVAIYSLLCKTHKLQSSRLI